MEKISVETIIKANISKVWDGYTKPEHIVKWNFASPEWKCPTASNDLKDGGKFSYRMESIDGSMGFDFEGVYTSVIDQSKISYVMPDGRTCVTTFDFKDDETSVVTTFDAESENPADMQKQGWQSILNSFKHYIESSS